MRVVPLWSKKIQLDNQEQCIYSVCFNPDGNQLVVAAGQRVLVYDTAGLDSTGAVLLQALRGHKETVYCVSYSYDGKRFASGSSDKNVIIWTNKLEGVLKYGHSDALQCLSWNPVTGELASCSLTEFVFWSAQVKSVNKQKAPGRVTSCSWSPDGRLLAIGLTNGSVTLRQRNTGEEKFRIERPSGPESPIWALAFSYHKEDNNEVLCVTDWNQTLSFYSTAGKLVGKERAMGFEALDVCYMQDSEYIVACGCNNSCNLYTREGIKLTQVGGTYTGWLWSVASHPKLPHLAMGCQDGTLSYSKVAFSTVHGLYKERYAYRENATDVIIQHLLTNQKVKIKCRDLVKRIAIYKHRLAVQLTEKIVVYELYTGEGSSMHYRVKEKLTSKTPCNLLVVTTNHLILCQEKRLQCLTFGGVKEREWEMDAAIRYIKVVGGPPNRECLLVGLANGQVSKIFLDNAFPVNLLKIDSSIRNLDLSQSKQKVAIVDDNLQLIVYDLRTKQPIYLERNADSVAWNSSYEDILCFSGNNTLSIKADNFPIHQQKLAGYVVGFCGSRIFCLHTNSISTLEVPLSAQMYQYLDKKLFNEAYLIACLGVTDNDWKSLAHAALEALDFNTAKKAFKRIKDIKYLDLIADMEDRQYKGERSREVLLGDIHAYKAKYKEAAKLYQSSNNSSRALNMYTDLRMFDHAQDFVGSGDSVDRKTLLRKKADWAQNIKEPRAAAEMYLSAGDTLRAVEIMVENSWVDMLVEVGRKASKDDVEVLRKVGEGLHAAGDLTEAAHVYRKLGEEENVLKLHVEAKRWQQAFALASAHPKFKHLVYVPYAQYLAENDSFLLAQKAYRSAGQPEEALRVLKQLTENAVQERRFNDASYYYWLLAKQALALASECNGNERDSLIQYYRKNEQIASLYYAYHTIYRYLEEPFTSCQPEALFNIARYLMQEIKIFRPPGISTFAILYALSKQARNLGAYKLARQVLDRMQSLRIPPKFQEYVDTATLLTKGKAYHDSEDLLVMCYRCSTYNPLMPPQHTRPNSCTNCGQPFVHSFVTFEVLPLVEFELEEGLSDAEALRLLENQAQTKDGETGWSQTLENDVQALTLDDTLSSTVDPFTDTMLTIQGSGDEFVPIVVKRSMLESMDMTNVLICKYPEPLRYRYFRNLMPGDMQVTICPHCYKIFHIDDFEMKLLEKGHCPFCRNEEGEEDLPIEESTENNLIMP